MGKEKLSQGSIMPLLVQFHGRLVKRDPPFWQKKQQQKNSSITTMHQLTQIAKTVELCYKLIPHPPSRFGLL